MTESNDPRVVALEGVQEELELLRSDVRSTRDATTHRIKTMRRLLFGFFALTLVAGYSSLQSRRAVDDIIATRKDSRVIVCQNDNHFIENHNALVSNVQAGVDLVNQPNPSRTPAQQVAVDQFVANYKAQIERSRLEPRDCSPAGIEAYYAPK